MSEINFLEMSDEDLMKHAAPVATETPAAVVEPEPVVEPVVETTETTDVVEPVVETGDDDDVEELTEEEQAAAANLLAIDDAELGDKPPVVAEAKSAPAKAKPVEAAPAKPVTEAVVMSAEDFQKEILAPFKANGRDMQVKSVEEARTLMQQGAGYNKKMESLKPHLAIVKQLEQHGLLDNDKIGFLIDLSKKNPEAIGKLLKDSGIDPLDIDSDKVEGYTPNTYAISDSQMDFDSVLEELKDNEHFQPVIHAVANEWDVASQQQVAAKPEVLRKLTTHKEMGVYDVITTEVERRKALGQLRGVPALAAYAQIGDEFEAAGKFAHLVKAPVATAPPTKKTVAAVAAKPAEDPAVIQRRKAAAATASANALKTAEPDFNPLAMSDADFAKLKLPV